MSKIKRYIAFCEENGYTNKLNEVVSMKYAKAYMKTQKYAEEHDEQERIRCDNIFSKEFIKDLNDFCDDHWKHFECLPTEFKWDNKFYHFGEFIKYVDENSHHS